MRIKYILFLTIVFSSCKQRLKVTMFKSNELYIVDTTENADKFLPFDIQSSDYPIYYIGPRRDTIKIGRRYWRGRTQWTNDFTTKQTTSYSDKTLNIVVDTSIRTNSPVEYLSENLKTKRDSTVNYNSFLFSIKNISDSTIYLGRSFSVFFINREAKDQNGNWIKIDKKISELGISLTGEPRISLNPNEVIISKVKRYKGAFLTDFRLVFGYDKNIAYSNIFRDSIDIRTLRTYSVSK